MFVTVGYHFWFPLLTGSISCTLFIYLFEYFCLFLGVCVGVLHGFHLADQNNLKE